jgi:hypothetical protein
MQSGSAARTASNGVTSSLSYIDTLVSGATAQGLYSITVDGSKLTNGMVSTLRSYGYTVETKYDTMGTYPRYIVSW